MTKFTTLVLLAIMVSSCSENKIIYVAPALQNCEVKEGEKCLMIKERKEDDWQLFSGIIDGFEYKEGFLYKIEVKVTKSKENEALKYELLKIIYQESSKQVVLPTPSILGKWTVERLSGIDSLEKQPTLHLEEGKISGNAGCNNYSASCEIKEQTIAIGLAIATKMYCTNMKVEKAFFDCLQRAKTFRKEADKLILLNEDGEELMQCSPSSD